MFNDRRADLFPATLSSSPLLRRGNSDFFRGICNTLWPIKWKCGFEQVFVVGGYTRGGSGRAFGALIMGYDEGAKLRYASKVGTGFSAALIRQIITGTESIRQDQTPYRICG
jgi:ATP-dependent DNA ligase